MAITSSIANGFWGTYTSLMGTNRRVRQKAAQLFRKLSQQKYAEIYETLAGAAAGSAASRTVAQVQHVEAPGAYPNQGAVETRTLVSANTTAAQETEMEYMFTDASKSRPSSYAADASGNGGGGKLQD